MYLTCQTMTITLVSDDDSLFLIEQKLYITLSFIIIQDIWPTLLLPHFKIHCWRQHSGRVSGAPVAATRTAAAKTATPADAAPGRATTAMPSCRSQDEDDVPRRAGRKSPADAPQRPGRLTKLCIRTGSRIDMIMRVV